MNPSVASVWEQGRGRHVAMQLILKENILNHCSNRAASRCNGEAHELCVPWRERWGSPKPNFTFLTVSPRPGHVTSLLGEIRAGGPQMHARSNVIGSKLTSFSSWSRVSTWELWATNLESFIKFFPRRKVSGQAASEPLSYFSTVATVRR